MRLLKWLLNFDLRHHRDFRRYERGGRFIKIFTIIILTITSIIPAACVLFLGSGSESFLLNIVLIILALGFTLGNIENGIVYAICGFRSYRKGSAFKDYDEDYEEGSKLDLFVGIYSILTIFISLGLLVLAIGSL